MSEKEEQELKILEFMKDKDYTPMKAKEMAIILGVPKKEYNEFLEILKQLEEKEPELFNDLVKDYSKVTKRKASYSYRFK